MSRTDVHRPSAINTGDYDFVACELIKDDGDIGTMFAQQMERQRIMAHMAATGGKYSTHAHGGNCHVCGNANAIYTMLFHHVPTNTYIRVGQDCAEKMDVGPEAFRRLTKLRDGVNDDKHVRAGQAKAQRVLEEAGVGDAWAVFERYHQPGPAKEGSGYEEQTISDIVGKLVSYGSISGPQMNFLGKLLVKIAERPQLEAKRAAEREAAADIVTSEKRIRVKGEVLSIKLKDSFYGSVFKLTLKLPDGGKLYGSLPKGLEVQKGDLVEFTAKVEASKDDAKFGFFSRPTKPVVLGRAANDYTKVGSIVRTDSGLVGKIVKPVDTKGAVVIELPNGDMLQEKVAELPKHELSR
jgi:hypothetical protein